MKNKYCKDCGKEEVKGKGMCNACYSKDYRRNNKEKVKIYSDMRYRRDKEKALKCVKKWYAKNKSRVIAQKQKWKEENSEYEKIRQRTRHAFKHLKTKCQECPETKDLHFHHLEPLAYDNFKVLCRKCHMKAHGRLLETT